MCADGKLAFSAQLTKINRIQSIFGRLAYLSRLRNPDTGEYESVGLPYDNRTSGLLRTEHEQRFAQWLACSIQEKRTDIECYLAELGHGRLSVLRTWHRLRIYRVFVPASAQPAEEALYLYDLEALIEVLLGDLVPDCEIATATVCDWRIREVLLRAEASFGDVSLSLKEVATGVRISSHRLGALFKKATGLSFRDYIRRIRMRRALVLLADPKCHVAEIAGALGYSSPANFINDFHRYFGASPTQYRSGFRQDVGKRVASHKTVTA